MTGWPNTRPPKPRTPAFIETPTVQDVFSAIVVGLRERLPDSETVVDVECTFKHISIDKEGGILALFNGDQKQTSMEIRLATRVRKSEA
jgi:hypothetical protein